MTVQPIVEGPGDELAIPVLIRRILSEHVGCRNPLVLRPYKVDRGQMVQEHKCKHYLTISQLDPRVDYVVQVLDADDDCAKDLNERLIGWSATSVYRTGFDLIVIEKEFECWMLAGIVSLRGVRRISEDAEPPVNANLIRGAKGRLDKFMPKNTPYSETADQAALAAVVDLNVVASVCPSFSRFLSKLREAHGQFCNVCSGS